MSEGLKLIEQILAHAEDEKTNRSWAADDVGWENVDAIWHKAEQLKKLLKEQDAEIEQLNRFVNGFSRAAVVPVRCKDCKHYTGGLDGYCDKLFRKTGGEMWFCANGEST